MEQYNNTLHVFSVFVPEWRKGGGGVGTGLRPGRDGEEPGRRC